MLTFKVGDRIEVTKKEKRLFKLLNNRDANSVHIVTEAVDVRQLPHMSENDIQSVGHAQWLRTDLHPEQISGVFFRRATKKE